MGEAMGATYDSRSAATAVTLLHMKFGGLYVVDGCCLQQYGHRETAAGTQERRNLPAFYTHVFDWPICHTASCDNIKKKKKQKGERAREFGDTGQGTQAACANV